MMNLIYNCDAITPPLTGIGRYALNLGLALQASTAIKDMNLFSHRQWLPDLKHVEQSNVWLSRLKKHIPFKHTALKFYHHQRCHHFQKMTHDMRDHVFHSPNFIAMPFDGPTVVTFHDLSFVHFRETQPDYRLRFLDQAIPQTLEQASHIITPSEYVKHEIIDHFGFDASRISVTPLGVDAGFHPRSADACNQALSQFGLKHRQFILAVATAEPRKNLVRLIKAYQQLDQATRQAHPLVLVGGSGWKGQSIQQAITTLVQSGEAVVTGFVADEVLYQLYASATVLAFPSLYEGFGLPIIEAMASATPVLTSDHSAMKEVAQDVAILVNPLEVDHLKRGLQKATEDKEWQHEAQSKGPDRTKQMTWNLCARKTIQCYQSCG